MAEIGEKMDEKISIREFARRMKVRDTSVHKAIKSGKIVAGVQGSGTEKKILFETARREWAAAHDPTYAQRSPALTANLAGQPIPAQSPTAPAVGGSVEKEAGDTSLASAKRLQSVIKAKTMSLELQRLQGTLVDKNEVNKQLFALGQELKSAILAVPDRCIDDIMACTTRGAAFQLLYSHLVDALTAMSDGIKRGVHG